MFIVIDGIDGSGKWTQIELVAKELEKQWKTVKILDFHRYWEKSAFMVEKYLNWDYWTEISAKQASIFYAVDRFQAYHDEKKDMKEYDYILSNRYVSANMIHQAGKISDIKEKEEFLEWLSDLEYNIFGIPKPDKTIFLNVSPQMSQMLVLKKEKREYLKWWKKMDLHEEDKNHLINAHASAMSIVQQNLDWVKIDCEEDLKMRNIDDITKNILDVIIYK